MDYVEKDVEDLECAILTMPQWYLDLELFIVRLCLARDCISRRSRCCSQSIADYHEPADHRMYALQLITP